MEIPRRSASLHGRAAAATRRRTMTLALGCFALLSPRFAYGFSSVLPPGDVSVAGMRRTTFGIAPRRSPVLRNVYDDWRSDAVVDTMHLTEENVLSCLDEFVESDYGKQMFGVHDLPASHGITGCIEFVSLCGPEVTLRLYGKFWHRRGTVLGRAAMWLNARMPEITDVLVEDPEELKDEEEVTDEFTGEVLYTLDKRSPDFNGDRETMEYQGIDPDVRGPFPSGVGGLRPGGSMINPA